MAPDRLRFPRSQRLVRRADFSRVAREGKRIRTEHLELRVVASFFRHPRVGIIVPKYRENSVMRNRLKRRLRTIIRVHVLRALPPMDVVIRARREAYHTTQDVLAHELQTASRRLQTLCRSS